MVKVAAINYPPQEDLWQKLESLQHENVIKTYETHTDGRYYYEVQEYCPNGTLADLIPSPGSKIDPLSADRIMNEIIPQVVRGLNYLQDHEIIHRDIKPENIYIRSDGTLALGDFDISSTLATGVTSRNTDRLMGSWEFTAPDALPRLTEKGGKFGRIARECDYYSLGVVIIKMSIGATPLSGICDSLVDVQDFYLQGGKIEVPESIPARLRTILGGLLIRNRQSRWGFDEVERWITASNTEGDLRRINQDERFEFVTTGSPYRLEDLTVRELSGLADAITSKPQVAETDLMTGDGLLNWIAVLDSNVARAIRTERETWRKAPEVVAFCAVTCCDPYRPFYFGNGLKADTIVDWANLAEKSIQDGSLAADRLVSDSALAKLEIWLKYKSVQEKMLADKVAATRARKDSPEVRFEEVCWLILPQRPYWNMQERLAEKGRALTIEELRALTNTNVASESTPKHSDEAQKGAAVDRHRGVNTPHEIASVSYGRPQDWSSSVPAVYDTLFQRWKDGFLFAWMRQRGLGDNVDKCLEIKKNLSDHPYAAYETTLRILDSTLKPVEITLDTSHIRHGLSVRHGTSQVFDIPYATKGCGIPFGTPRLTKGQPGLTLETKIISTRTGVIQLRLDSKGGMPVSKSLPASVMLESGFTVANPLNLSCNITYPNVMTAGRVLLAALVGMILLGIPRWIMSVNTELQHPAAAGQMDIGVVWRQTMAMQFPYSGSLAGVLILLLSLWIGWKIWMAALKKSAT